MSGPDLALWEVTVLENCGRRNQITQERGGPSSKGLLSDTGIISRGEVSLQPPDTQYHQLWSANGREAPVTLHPTLLGLGPWNCQAVRFCCVRFRVWEIRPRPWASHCPSWVMPHLGKAAGLRLSYKGGTQCPFKTESGRTGGPGDGWGGRRGVKQLCGHVERGKASILCFLHS